MQLSSPRRRRSDHRDDRDEARLRRISPSYESDRKRLRSDATSPEPAIPRSTPSHYLPPKRPPPSYPPPPNPSFRPRPAPFAHDPAPPPGHNGVNGGAAMYAVRAPLAASPTLSPHSAKSRKLYIGNVPFHVGLTDVALKQFFSALYVAGFRPNLPGEPLPVVSFWLHSDGKFGFMELRGEQETANMMQFNGIVLHARPLRVNRPSDYRPEIHNPAAANLHPEPINARAVVDLCEKLDGIVVPPPQLAAIAAAQEKRGDPPPAARPPHAPPRESPRASHGAAPTTNGSEANANDAPPPMEQDEISPAIRRPSPSQDRPSVRDATTEEPHSTSNSDANGLPAEKTENMESKVEVKEETQESTDAVVVSLQNLVTDQDLNVSDEEYLEVVEDVETECGNYGDVVSVNIPRTGPWKRTAFVQFRDTVGAKKAVEALAKRVFDGRRIAAVGVVGCATAAEAAARPRN